ncbi:MAG: Maf and M48 domain-containing protein [Candidatus Omnitrophota bacterium]|nr:Maf and M48 domain-containing protein [Candidatus Omnitrophota bacterium]
MKRKIILASASIQRKKILHSLGVKFKVMPSRAREKRRITSSCARLTIENALAKAREVSKRVKSGTVIAADTVVFCGNKIIGKPKNLTAAKRMLKELSETPQWVYTGLAVIDVGRNKTITGYEKTKVYIERLSDFEIDNYFRKVSPLNKAGGFDIQGPGSIFIKRIEGCFYNVVGLPVAKLQQLLKKIGAPLLMLMLFFLSGCYTEYNIATEKQETLFYSTEKEVNLGDGISREFEKKYKPLQDTVAQERVEGIGEKIASVCDRKELIYHFKVVDDKEVNALSLPGGYVYVNKGLLERVKNDDELAGVIAHEVAHIVAKHSVKKLQAMWGYSLLTILASQGTDPDFAQGVNLAFVSIFLGYSREDESLADKLAVKYLRKAGYNPQGMVDFLVALKEVHRKEPDRPFSYWRTHPYIAQRIALVKQEVTGKMEFKDYLNLEKEK